MSASFEVRTSGRFKLAQKEKAWVNQFKLTQLATYKMNLSTVCKVISQVDL